MTARQLRITVVTTDKGLSANLALRLQGKGFQINVPERIAAVLGVIYADPPDVIIIDLNEPQEQMLAIILSLKGDAYFSAIPVIGLMNPSLDDTFDWTTCPIDDFIVLPLKYQEFFARLNLSLKRIDRIFDNNPLTRLPGNTSIQKAIESSIGKPMAVCYSDINNFKPFNDVYGFSHGDEVLRMLARVIFNAVKESGGGFVGHIGGDDFVFIVPQVIAEEVSQTVIRNFDIIASDLFGEEERQQGYYVALNRKGEVENVPLMGLAIAIVPLHNPKIQHYGKVAEIAAELKKLAKKSEKSCYYVDLRTT